MIRRIVVLAALPLTMARAQAHSHEARAASDQEGAQFVADARAATLRYRDRSVAIADGYRQVGPDLPAMGEHWLNIRLVLADTLDVAHPPVLIYVASPHGRVLAGAAYTRLLGPDDAYPDFPRGLHAWHDHSGFIEDEALPMAHARHATVASKPQRLRLGILHLWMGVENPAGAWTADNLALAYVRAGVSAPAVHSEAAARALTLAADSGRYYLGVLTTVGHLDPAQTEGVQAVLETAAAEVNAVTFERDRELTTSDVARLDAIWRTLWPRLEPHLLNDSVGRLAELRAAWW